jgi:hypothetical protein
MFTDQLKIKLKAMFKSIWYLPLKFLLYIGPENEHKASVRKLNAVSEATKKMMKESQKIEKQNERERIEDVVCKLKPTQDVKHWNLEFTNNSPSTIRVIKVSAESYYRAIIMANHYVPDFPGSRYQPPVLNSSDEILIRNIESGSSISIERVMLERPTTKLIWMKVQISQSLKDDETFSMKQIRVLLEP